MRKFKRFNRLRLKKEAGLYGIDIRIITRKINKVKKKKKTTSVVIGKTCNNFGKTWLATHIICNILLHGLYVYRGGAEISGTN